MYYVLLNWTRMGRYFYAIGGNLKASRLSGINTRFYLFMAYVLCGALAACSGIMLTARLETGEANIGATMPLEFDRRLRDRRRLAARRHRDGSAMSCWAPSSSASCRTA